jgi:hypothetical protein
MSARDLEITRRAWTAVQAHDLDGFLAFMDPEIEFVSLISEAEGGFGRGHEGVRNWWETVTESLGGLHYATGEPVDLGEGYVLTRVVISGNVSGVEVPQTMWHVAEIRGEVASWWSVFRTEAEARHGAWSRRAGG